jgi:hypothetical protein
MSPAPTADEGPRGMMLSTGSTRNLERTRNPFETVGRTLGCKRGRLMVAIGWVLLNRVL